jgi:hypothetical protein
LTIGKLELTLVEVRDAVVGTRFFGNHQFRVCGSRSRST